MPFHYQIEFKPTGSGRRIKGTVSTPTPDRENEIISPSAFREALKNFMKHPILHVQHTERPVGIVHSATVQPTGKTDIEAEIFSTDDTDDIWDSILKGTLCKYSIYGKRKVGNDACKLAPTARRSPCITKSLDLWSISLVGNNAINQETFVEIAKANLPEEESDHFLENLALIYKSETSNDGLKGEIMVPEPEPVKEEIQTIEESPELSVVKSANDDRLTKIEASIEIIAKAVEKLAAPAVLTDETPQNLAPIVTKADDVDLEPIIKARVEGAVGDIRKSMDDLSESVKSLRATLDEMQETVVRKSGPVVYVPASDDEFNPYLANAAVIGR